MKRYPFNYRHTIYNEGDFYQFLPVARKPVVPGEKISSMEIRARILSAVYDKANVTPLMAQLWAFYVPNRLSWSQWIDFIALDPAVPSAPMTTTTFPQLYDVTANAPGVSVFPRRGFKRIYNQYFGQEDGGSNSWYADLDLDTDVRIMGLLAWDQLRASTKTSTGYTQATYVAPVSGPSATISLDDFQRALDSARALRRQRVSGDKYVDTMRLFGVELDWRIQMAPEFLGAAQVVIQPREKSSTQAQDAAGANLLWKRASEYQGSLTLNVRNKAFSEHGYIIVCGGFRPAFMTGQNPIDATMDVPADFYRPETGNVVETEARLRERFYAYTKAQNLIGKNTNGNIFVSTSAYYPPASDYVPISGSGPSAVAIGAECTFKGLTPVRPNVA